jgi:SagB-type dehydrogenase family enzyme
MVDARAYHERTKHAPAKLREEEFALDHDNRPRPYKSYVDRPRLALSSVRPPRTPTLSAIAEDRADPLAGTEQRPPEAPDRGTLATLCYEASGVLKTIAARSREIPFRAAACTGKLYHVDLYPVVADLDGLTAGVYHFDPRRFALDVLREGDYRGVLAEATGGQNGVTAAPVTFVATSTWWRNAWKYRERTYRHAFWDSGTVLANLLGAAHALDYRAEIVAGFADEAVADLLGIDPETEAPLELVPIGRDAPVRDAPAVDPIDPDTEPLSERVVEYPILHAAWTESALPDGEAADAWRDRARVWCGESGKPGTTGPGKTGDGGCVPLDPVDHGTASARPFHDTVRRRGSCREYAEEGPTRRQVGTVLDRAIRGVPGDWNGEGREEGEDGRNPCLNDAYVLATGVEGVPDGSYQFHPADGALERIGDVTGRTKARLALDQPWAGEAHVNVYQMVDVDAIVEELGDRGYRLAQLEAGVVLGRLYLATYAHRALGGTGLTFYDDLVAEHFSPRAAGLTPTCLFAFGRREGA